MPLVLYEASGIFVPIGGPPDACFPRSHGCKSLNLPVYSWHTDFNRDTFPALLRLLHSIGKLANRTQIFQRI